MAEQGAMRMALTSYVLVGLSFPLAYLLRLFYSQALSVEEFGAFFALISFVLIIATFNDFGLSEALAYFLPRLKRDEQNRYFTAAISVQTTTSLIVGALILIFADQLSTLITGSTDAALTLRILTGYFLGMNISTSIGSFLRGRQDTAAYTSVESARLASTILMSIIAGFVSNTLHGYAIAWVSGVVIVNVFFAAYGFRKHHLAIKRFDAAIMRTMTVYAIPLIIASSSTVIMSYLDTVMVSSISGTLEAGYYSVALPTAKLLLIITVPIALIAFPLTSKKHYEKEFAYLSTFFRYTHEAIILAILPATGILLVFAPEILRIIFGEAYILAAPILVVLALTFALGGIVSVQANIIAGLGKTKARALFVVIAGIVNVIMNLILIPSYGGIGAAIGLLVANIIVIAGFSIAIRKEVGFSIRPKVVLVALFGSALATTVAIILKRTLAINMYLEAAIILITMGLIYGSIVLVSRVIDWKELFRIIRTTIPSTERVFRHFD